MSPTPMIPTRALLCHDMTRMERYDQTKLDELLLELNNRDTTPNDSWILDYPNISIYVIYSNMNVIDQTCNINNIKKRTHHSE